MLWKFLVLFAYIGICHAEEWRSLFNGRDLEGWSGEPRLWRVENGCIVGETDAAGRAIQANRFLIREDIEPGDFVLEFKARVTGQNNSGVQYRSQRPEPDGWVMTGYQLDLHPNAEYLGMLYEEKGRGICCKRGEIVTLGEKPKVTGALEMDEVKLEEWNTYRIEAKGNELTHYVNGKPAAKIRDVSKKLRSEKGLIGLQLHAGPPMKAEFKEIRWMPAAATSGEDMTGSVKLPPDFKLERIYQVPKEQGSWVSMTMRPDGGFYCSDQYGEITGVRL